MGWPSISMPSLPTVTIPTPKIKPPTLPTITIPNIPTITPPTIPIPDINIPDASHPTSMLTTGITKIGEGIGAVGEQLHAGGQIINRNLHELAKLGKEAISGQGGYSDDDPAGPGPAAPGPTGFEAASAQRTLLTGQRKKGAGRSAHAGSGSAGRV